MIENFIGLCVASGGVKTGFDTVLTEVRQGRAKAVIIANDASERTTKQLRDKCTYYKVKHYTVDYSGEELARMLGKRSGCVAAAIGGRGPWNKVVEALESAKASSETHENEANDRKDD